MHLSQLSQGEGSYKEANRVWRAGEELNSMAQKTAGVFQKLKYLSVFREI